MKISNYITLRRCVWLGTLALLSAGTWLLTRSVFAQTYAPVPVFVKYAGQSVGYNGQVKKTESTLAVRSDGSRVEARVMVAPDGSSHLQRTVTDLVSAKKMVVEPISQSITTYLLKDLDVLARRMPASGCEKFTPDGSILGHAVVRNTNPMQIPHGSQKVDSWYAPALGCVLLKEQFVKLKEDGTNIGSVLREAVQITTGEPSAELFEIPGWQERSPKGVMEELQRKFSLHSFNTEAASKMDNAYSLQQSR